jgi:hypothetical protein
MRWTTCDPRVDNAGVDNLREVASAVDEQRLAELFRTAAGDAPPPSFGTDEVIAASRRATARRRSALAGGTLLGVAVLAGGVVTVGQLLPENAPPAAQAAPRAGAASPSDARPFALPAPAVPEPRSLPGHGGLLGCGSIDRQLAAQVTPMLAARQIEQAGSVTQVPEPCPQGSRSVAIPVTGGTLFVMVVPEAGQSEPVEINRPDGARGYAVALDGGRGLAVISMPSAQGQQAPYAVQLPDLARELAGRL